MDKIILVGFQGSGKNTVGEYLIEQYGYIGISFADALKDAVASIFCWDRGALEGVTPETREWREQVDLWWAKKLGIVDFTPRWAMRNFGTEVMRQHFNQDIWINNVERRLLDFGSRKVVVTDGRFPNEIDLIVKKFSGISIRVKRGPEPEWWDTAIAANGYGDGWLERSLAAEDLRDIWEVHPSEYAWVGHSLSATLSNDTSITELRQQVDRVMV